MALDLECPASFRRLQEARTSGGRFFARWISPAVMFAVVHLTEKLKERYGDLPEVQRYVDAVQSNVVETMDEARRSRASSTSAGSGG